MRMIIRAAILLSLLCPLMTQAGVYKWVDDKGNVHYSDQNTDTKAKKVDLPENSTYKAPPAPKLDLSADKKNKGSVISNGYKSISIANPANDSTVRSAPGNITISVKTDPALMPGDKIKLMINGIEKMTAAQTSFSFEHIDRGTHTITAAIVRSDGRVSLVSKPSVFHLKR